jgi:aubergine-like protein
LLPGGKDGSDLYPDLKRLLLEEIPIISQIVLTGTINYGKNLKTIVSKIIAQICAKIGGVPWVVDGMPLFDKPTMIVGMKTYHEYKHQQQSVFGLVATYNKTATKYWSTTRH